jgi:hypothetical protein
MHQSVIGEEAINKWIWPMSTGRRLAAWGRLNFAGIAFPSS